MRLENYAPPLLPALVRFWNRAFAGKRNFFPVTEALLRERITEKRTAVESFDPAGFIAALEGGEMAGFLHAGVRPEGVCRAVDPDWAGGTQGYVAFLFVDPAFRRKGLGTELWNRGLEWLGAASRRVIVDGQCINPFYGNCEGPFTPFWGTPEGVSVEWDDTGTKMFFARQGHAPRHKAVQLSLDAANAPEAPLEMIERQAFRMGLELRYENEKYPEAGQPEGKNRVLNPGCLFECVTAAKKGETAGLLSYYPMKEVRPGLFGIYEVKVMEKYQGHGVGKFLLAAALERLRAQGFERCEVLTLPDISGAALALYSSSGFLPAAEWAIY